MTAPTKLKTSEQDFTGQVLDLCRIFRWRTIHIRPARTNQGWRTPISGDGAGWPDCTMLRPPRLVVAELKTGKGRLTEDQSVWLDMFRQIPGVEAYVWRPEDLDDIAKVLR